MKETLLILEKPLGVVANVLGYVAGWLWGSIPDVLERPFRSLLALCLFLIIFKPLLWLLWIPVLVLVVYLIGVAAVVIGLAFTLTSEEKAERAEAIRLEQEQWEVNFRERQRRDIEMLRLEAQSRQQQQQQETSSPLIGTAAKVGLKIALAYFGHNHKRH